MSGGDAFPVRHRGAHVPDYVRRLEQIASGPSLRSSRGAGSSFRPLAPPQSRRDLVPRGDGDRLATFFGNLTVWIDQTMRGVSTHAGYEKIYLYTAVLKAFVDDVVPLEEIQHVVDGVDAYVAYLSSTPRGVNSPAASPRLPKRPMRPVQSLTSPTRSSMASPRNKSVLSPRVIRVMAKDATEEAALHSPRITKKPPKKIIELSDHEESILEVALFYEEVVAQLARPAKKKSSKPVAPSLTQRWLLFSTEKRTRTLKKVKNKITRSTLFVSAAHSPPMVPTTPSGTRVASPPPASAVGLQNVDLSSYFSLLMLCLQETIRRISVFSSEIAVFAWSTLCQETLCLVEAMFDEVVTRLRRSQEELQVLKLSRSEVEGAISHCEREIQRLQAQNMRSLVVWRLEKDEMTMLEQEETWHGYCKSLLLKTLLTLREEVNQATWLQVRASGDANLAEESDPLAEQDEGGAANSAMEDLAHVTYQRLPAGAALLHFRLRSRVVYMAHLLILCRSFLHLHEKRGLREVMESTSTNPRWSDPPSPKATRHSPSMHDMFDGQLGSSIAAIQSHTSAMERISVNELLTLKEINDALRAIEELYVSVGGSGDHSSSRSSPPFARTGCDASTQIPVIGSSDPATKAGFLHALSYSTVAAGTFTSAPPFVRAGSTTSRRRNAETAAPRVPMGSGRRQSSSSGLQQDDPHKQAQPLIRLAKAVVKLPRLYKDVLILPLLHAEPFPSDSASSIVESLTKDEILARIQWMYASVIETSFASSSSVSARGSAGNAKDAQLSSRPIPLSHHLWASWTSEQFVVFIHAAFLEKYNDDVFDGEREFVRFFASIQLLFSGLAAALNSTTSGSGPSQTMDNIYFFARITRLFNLDARDKIMKSRLPAQLFPLFFYCMHVLDHVALTKKHIEEGGLSMDVWTIPGSQRGDAETFRSSSPKSRSTRRGAPAFPSHSFHSSKFVLFESVETLLMYLLDSTSPDASVIIADRITFLTERASLAKVALLSSITPGAYELASSPAHQHEAPSPVVNGELTDALILPLDFAVLTIVNAWTQQHRALLDRLSVAMRAANISASGEISFEEFTHVMLVGSAATAPSSVVRPNQLTQIYASLLASTSTTRDGVRWQDLVVAVADEIDLMGVNERLENVDFRSIQHAILRGTRGAVASPWVLNPAYRSGDAVSLRKTWDANRQAMRDSFALTFQADNALEGISLWETGSKRMARVERLLHDGTKRAKTSRGRMRRTSVVVAGTPVSGRARRRVAVDDDDAVEMAKEDLDVAWRALFYLQLDHAQTHHIADAVRAKQLRSTQTAAASKA